MSHYSDRQLQEAANAVILAMDGKIRRHDAVLCAKAVLYSMGFTRAGRTIVGVDPASPAGDATAVTRGYLDLDGRVVVTSVEVSAPPMPETPMVPPV